MFSFFSFLLAIKISFKKYEEMVEHVFGISCRENCGLHGALFLLLYGT